MKDEKQIKRWIKELQEVAEVAPTTTLESRMAYYAYHLLRRVVEDVKDWPDPVTDLKDTVHMIEQESQP